MHVSISKLSKTYRSKESLWWAKMLALDAVSLEIGAGQVVCIVGANGAGKTTLLRLLSTLAAPTSGAIHLDGADLNRSRIDLRRRLFFLADTPLMLEQRTVARHIATVAGVYGRESAELAGLVADRLAELDMLQYVEQKVHDLSRGQRYKVAFATLLAVDCELWLVDEPFASGVDPLGQAAIRKHFRAAADRGRTVIFTTQILELAQSVADWICVLHQGRVRVFDPVQRFALAASDAKLDAILNLLRSTENADAGA
jgi:ABC-2 type transport system ATP-binding protein